MTASRAQATRLLVIGALLAGAAVSALLFLQDDEALTLNARFANAGQIVKGGEVQVAGRKVGSIEDISLTDDGQAKVRMHITDRSVLPIRRATTASIRAVGQAGVANRYVELDPAPAGPSLSDGATLPATHTRGIVELDSVLSTFTPATRRQLGDLIAHSDQIFAGSTAPRFRGMAAQLSPALDQLGALATDVSADRAALAALIDRGAVAAKAIASRRPDLRGALDHVAVVLESLADERGALGASIARAPRLLARTTTTLENLTSASRQLTPVLRRLPATAAPAATLAGHLPRTLRRATPAVAALNRQLPGLTEALNGMPRFAPATARALRATQVAATMVRPIASGLRTYGLDLILGIFNGLAGLATGNYDARGQYVRLAFTQDPQTLFGGRLGDLLGKNPLVPGVLGTRYHLVRRCPGGGAPPAPDGSSPFIPEAGLCDPAHDMPASVNEP